MAPARKLLKRDPRRTRSPSLNASAVPSNLNRGSTDSTAGPHDSGLGSVAGSTDPTASGNNALLNKNPTTPSRPASASEGLTWGTAKGHGGETTRISTPTLPASKSVSPTSGSSGNTADVTQKTHANHATRVGSRIITSGPLFDEPTGYLPPLDSNATSRQGFTASPNSAMPNIPFSPGITPFSPLVDHAGIQRESQHDRPLDTMGPVPTLGDERQGSLDRSLNIPDVLLPGHQAQDSNSKSPVKDVLVVALKGLEMLLKKVEGCLSGTPAKLPVAVINALIDIKNAVRDNKDAIGKLIDRTTERLLVVDEDMDQGVPGHARPRMEVFARTLREQIRKLEEMSKKGGLTRILMNEADKKEINDIFIRIEEATKTFHLGIALNTNRKMDDVHSEMKLRQLRDFHASKAIYNADLGGGATGNRRPCGTGTCEGILEEIFAWADNISADSPPVFWLIGQAGSGKTTIAYTITQSFDDREMGHSRQHTVLGGNFFCSRQFEETRRQVRIIPTLVCHLARKSNPYFHALCEADKFDLANNPLKQMKDLLVGPWQQSESQRPKGLPPYLIVVDALDEIEDSGGGNFLLDLLETIDKGSLCGLRFLVTSRPGHRIAEFCEAFSSKVVWHELEPDEIGLETMTQLADGLSTSAATIATADPSTQQDPLSKPQVGQSFATSSIIATMFENCQGLKFNGGTYLAAAGNVFQGNHNGLVPQNNEQSSPVQREVHMFRGLKDSEFGPDAGNFVSSAGEIIAP